MKRIALHALGALVVTAVLALPALAAERPDDRAGTLGVGSTPPSTPIAPTDVVERAVLRHNPALAPTDVVERAVLRHNPALAAERPNDRAGTLGVGSTATSPNTVATAATIPGRPDGRQMPDSIDLPATEPTILATSGGFDWGDAAIGLAGGLGLALILLGGYATSQHTRRLPDAT